MIDENGIETVERYRTYNGFEFEEYNDAKKHHNIIIDKVREYLDAKIANTTEYELYYRKLKISIIENLIKDIKDVKDLTYFLTSFLKKENKEEE